MRLDTRCGAAVTLDAATALCWPIVKLATFSSAFTRCDLGDRPAGLSVSCE